MVSHPQTCIPAALVECTHTHTPALPTESLPAAVVHTINSTPMLCCAVLCSQPKAKPTPSAQPSRAATPSLGKAAGGTGKVKAGGTGSVKAGGTGKVKAGSAAPSRAATPARSSSPIRPATPTKPATGKVLAGAAAVRSATAKVKKGAAAAAASGSTVKTVVKQVCLGGGNEPHQASHIMPCTAVIGSAAV